MEAKLFEIRDEGTSIPAMAIKPRSGSEQERYLMSRAGYGTTSDAHGNYVILVTLATMKAAYDEYEWGSRTMQVAHRHIIDKWPELTSGDVIDVQYIIGESKQPKQSERTELESRNP